MPIPMFRDYDKEDHLNKDYTYRTKDSHTPSPLVRPDTLKPHPYGPDAGTKQGQRAWINWKRAGQENRLRRFRWRKDHRLSKTKQKKWTSV